MDTRARLNLSHLLLSLGLLGGLGTSCQWSNSPIGSSTGGTSSSSAGYSSGSGISPGSTAGNSSGTGGAGAPISYPSCLRYEIRDIKVQKNLLVAATSCCLAVSQDGGQTFYQYQLGNQGVTRVDIGPDGALYASTPMGLWISHDHGDSYEIRTTQDGFSSDEVRGIALGADGSRFVAIAGSQGGLAISTDGGASYTMKTTSEGLPSNDVRQVVLHQSVLYLATAKGLAISKDGGKTFVNRGKESGLPDLQINQIHVSVNLLAVATQGGLALSKDLGTKFTSYTKAKGLGGLQAHSVTADSSGILYVSTENGISILRRPASPFENRTTKDGLLDSAIGRLFVDDVGTLWFTSSFGMGFSKRLKSLKKLERAHRNRNSDLETISEGGRVSYKRT